MNIYIYSLFGRHISFSLFMPITFEIVHIIQNTIAHEVLSERQKHFSALIICFKRKLDYLFNSYKANENHIW